MADEKLARDVDWSKPAALKRITDAAGCAEFDVDDKGCTLRYMGEMETMPMHLFRHSRYTDNAVTGGDIRVDAFRMQRMLQSDVVDEVSTQMKTHHTRFRVPGTGNAWQTVDARGRT